MPEPTPEAWAQIRHDYEHTDKPLEHICAEHDVSIPTVRYRMKIWGWQRRKPFVPRHGPPQVPNDPAIPDSSSRGIPPHPISSPCSEIDPGSSPGQALSPQAGRGEDIVPRLQGAVARVLPAIDATIARLASGTLSSDGLEKAGRALGALTRTLRELNALLAQHNAQPDGACPYCDGLPDGYDNIDDFRYDLARRIEAFVASRENPDSVEPGSALPLQAQK